MKDKVGIPAIIWSLVGVIALLCLVAAPAVDADNIGEEGCPSAYWKEHTSNWEEYSPTQTIEDMFDLPAELASYGNLTLVEGLGLEGGQGEERLLRAGIAA